MRRAVPRSLVFSVWRVRVGDWVWCACGGYLEVVSLLPCDCCCCWAVYAGGGS